MNKILRRNFWSQKWKKFKELCLLLKHFAIWLFFNFIISLVPVFIVFIIDYRRDSDNFNYSHTVFLGVMSFSFTLLVTSGYSIIVWERIKLVAGSITFFLLFIIAVLFVLYYSASPNFVEGTFPKIISDNKFIVVNSVLGITLWLSSYLNWSVIEKCRSNEIDREEKRKREKLGKQYGKLEEKLKRKL